MIVYWTPYRAKCAREAFPHSLLTPRLSIGREKRKLGVAPASYPAGVGPSPLYLEQGPAR